MGVTVIQEYLTSKLPNTLSILIGQKRI